MAKLLVFKTNIRMNTTSGGEEDYSTVLPPPWDSSPNTQTKVSYLHMSHLLLLGKFEYNGGPIFKVVLEC